jgi:hypothetical protein
MTEDDHDSLTLEELTALAEAEAEIARGERVPPEVIEAFWRKHGL